MTTQRSILIVDDHPLFREGVKTLISRAPGFTVIAEAGSAEQAGKLALELRPELILLDLSLPDGKGTDLIRYLSAELPQSPIVVLSMHSAIDMVAESFQAGAAGYIVKESAGESLIQALNAVSRGEQYLDSAISPKVIRKLMEYSDRKVRMTESSYDVLTRREQQILRMLAGGASTRTIAESLFISRKTVENHRANIMSKLGLTTPLDLVRYAMRKGLIAIDDSAPPASSGQ
jgi:DNA-binding NarL/FixJ family response regulator